MKIAAIIFILLIAKVYSFNSKHPLSSKGRGPTPITPDQAKVIDSFTNLFTEKLKGNAGSKIFNFLKGALLEFMHTANNPIADLILCVINTFRGYKKYTEESQGKKITQISDVNLALDDKTELMVIDDKEMLNDSDFAKLQSDEAVQLAEEEKDEELIYMQVQDEKEKTNSQNPQKDQKVKKDEKDMGTLRSFMHNIHLAGSKIKAKLKEKVGKIKEVFSRFKAYVKDLLQKPLFHSLLDFSICVIPSLLKIAANSMSTFAFAFSGGFAFNLISNSATTISGITSGVKKIIKHKADSDIKLRYEGYGKGCARILLALVLSFLNQPNTRCPSE